MKTYIYQDSAGVCLRVEYCRDSRGVLEFRAIHVLDSKYSPVGPDLSEFLHELVKLDVDGSSGSRFLSFLAEEIGNEERESSSVR